MDVVSVLVADREPAVLRKPGQRALHNPPVKPQLLAAVYALSCYTALYPTPSQSSLALSVVSISQGIPLLRHHWLVCLPGWNVGYLRYLLYGELR